MTIVLVLSDPIQSLYTVSLMGETTPEILDMHGIYFEYLSVGTVRVFK